MTIRHHLSDQLLMAYAAGQLPEAFNLVVATHVSMCDECRAQLASYDAVGGALMEVAEEIAMGEDALAQALSRIEGLAQATRAEPEDLDWGPEPEPDQAEAMEAQQDTDRLGRALAGLPQKQRALIERAYYGDLSHSEIAAETGLPLGTIKSRIRLALDKLRHDMT